MMIQSAVIMDTEAPGGNMTRKEILERAEFITNGDRDKQYGQPEDNFNTVAALWSAYLGDDIGPEDVAIMMILFKIARLKGGFYQPADSWIDIAGYAACGGEIAARYTQTEKE